MAAQAMLPFVMAFVSLAARAPRDFRLNPAARLGFFALPVARMAFALVKRPHHLRLRHHPFNNAFASKMPSVGFGKVSTATGAATATGDQAAQAASPIVTLHPPRLPHHPPLLLQILPQLLPAKSSATPQLPAPDTASALQSVSVNAFLEKVSSDSGLAITATCAKVVTSVHRRACTGALTKRRATAMEAATRKASAAASPIHEAASGVVVVKIAPAAAASKDKRSRWPRIALCCPQSTHFPIPTHSCATSNKHHHLHFPLLLATGMESAIQRPRCASATTVLEGFTVSGAPPTLSMVTLSKKESTLALAPLAASPNVNVASGARCAPAPASAPGGAPVIVRLEATAPVTFRLLLAFGLDFNAKLALTVSTQSLPLLPQLRATRHHHPLQRR